MCTQTVIREMPNGSDLIGEVAFPYISHHSSNIIDELKPEDGDFVLQKKTSGTFISTRLDSFLRNMDIESFLVKGVVTNFCVYATAREATDYGFQVVIVEDCCAAWSPELHDATLKSFGLLTGYVLTYEKVMKKISRILRKVKEEIAIH